MPKQDSLYFTTHLYLKTREMRNQRKGGRRQGKDGPDSHLLPSQFMWALIE